MPDPGTEATARPSLSDRTAVLVATLFGAGRVPFAPGTLASAITAGVLALAPFTRGSLVLFFVVVTIGGIWASHHAERVIGGKDPGAIVIDEVAGMTLSVLAVPLTPAVLAVAFVLFRVFDVVKPFPAGRSQRIRGGVGVMIDDLIAGLYALLVVWGLRRVLGWP
ncbi:MAG: phosphatidylglycerophosphatase A [Candidatus Rokubacteria bacterium]|nr:phosphatidylglycerophosphatase A [Candidatus Rokubacteria bacterium]